MTPITRDIAIKVRDTVDAGLVNGVGKPIPGQMCVEAAVCYALGLPHGDDPGCVAPSLRALKIKLNDSNWSSDQARAKGLRRLALAQLGSAGHLDQQDFIRRVVDYTIRTTVPRAIRIAASLIKDPKHKAAMIDAAVKCEKDGDRKSAIEAKNAANAAYAAYAADAADPVAYAAAYAADAAAYAADAADPVANAADAAAYAADAAANAANAAYAAANAADAAANAAAYADDAAAYAADAADAAANAADAAYADEKRDKELSLYSEAIVQILIDMKAPGCEWLDLVELDAAA